MTMLPSLVGQFNFAKLALCDSKESESELTISLKSGWLDILCILQLAYLCSDCLPEKVLGQDFNPEL